MNTRKRTALSMVLIVLLIISLGAPVAWAGPSDTTGTPATSSAGLTADAGGVLAASEGEVVEVVGAQDDGAPKDLTPTGDDPLDPSGPSDTEGVVITDPPLVDGLPDGDASDTSAATDGPGVQADTSNSAPSPQDEEGAAPEAGLLAVTPVLTYSAHVAYVGWQDFVEDGSVAGTTGRGLGVEALDIKMVSPDIPGGIEYRVYIQSSGWTDWSQSGEVAGTTGRSEHIEAVSLRLTGDLAERYDIYYRTHVAYRGWLDWAKDGSDAGSMGYHIALEALQIRLVDKGAPAPGATTRPMDVRPMTVEYQAHVGYVGWMEQVDAGRTAGTTGRSLSIEALKVSLINPTLGGGIEYRSYVQGLGWQDWVRDGALSGTTGRTLKLAVLQMRLTGDMSQSYSIHYRAHLSHLGWTTWAKDGQDLGSSYTLGIEAIEIVLLPKGAAPPSVPSNLAPYVSSAYGGQAFVDTKGWVDLSGNTLGTTGESLKLYAIKLSITDLRYLTGPISGNITYRAHIAYAGWTSWVGDGAEIGSASGPGQLEAVSIKLGGDASRYYDIYYRAHVQYIGWMGWAKNGADAGTSTLSRRMEALQITILPKGCPAPGKLDNSYIQSAIDPNKPMIAITIDGGPSSYSRSFVDVFNKYGAKGTFFVVGQYIGGAKSELQYIANSGHELANHSYSHPALTGLSASAIRSEITRTNDAIAAATGVTPKVMRPPYGSRNANVASAVGMPMIIWSVDTLDWSTANANSTARTIRSAKDGDIILIHDIPSSPAALDMALADLTSRGYQIVTVSELAHYKGYTMRAGGSYNSFK